MKGKREALIAASGLTPLQYLLSVLRDETAERSVRIDAAKAAAPFVHPKLATTTLQGVDGGPVFGTLVIEHVRAPGANA